MDFLNIDRMRFTVFRRMGVEEAPDEGVAGCLRRKSVRMSVPLGWGSEMLPKEDPLCLREEVFRRDTPRMHIADTVRRIPAMKPGKNPTSIARAGNLSQVSFVGIVPFVFVTGTTEADCVLIKEVVRDAAMEEEVGEEVGAGGGDFCWFAFMMHSLLVLQL